MGKCQSLDRKIKTVNPVEDITKNNKREIYVGKK